MINTRKKSKMLLATLIITIIQLTIIAFVAITLMCNLFGIVDSMDYILQTYVAQDLTIDYMLTSYYLELGMGFIVNLSAARLYYKGYKYNAFGEIYGKRVIVDGVFQLLFSSFVPGILAIITGIMLMKKKPVVVSNSEQDEMYINDAKLAAMSEAVTRLKELRDSGAISEEEYYANINKILES